jgi:formylglycine-generating enzyme
LASILHCARLPIEFEWEYACRAGTATAYSFGNIFDPTLANAQQKTAEVHSLPANAWGLCEMHGNVREWCQDWFGYYPIDPVVDPVGCATGGKRVLRGGSWIDDVLDLRSAPRHHDDPGARYRDVGFRLALGPELAQEGQGKGQQAVSGAVRPRGGGGR